MYTLLLSNKNIFLLHLLLLGTDHLTCKGGVMVFCFVQNFFLDNTRVRIFISFVAQFFFHNLTLGYMTKTLNQIIFFSSTTNIGNQNIFLEINHNPPLEVKWSVPYFFGHTLTRNHFLCRVMLETITRWEVFFLIGQYISLSF